LYGVLPTRLSLTLVLYVFYMHEGLSGTKGNRGLSNAIEHGGLGGANSSLDSNGPVGGLQPLVSSPRVVSWYKAAIMI
jgi:hypothetical protein